MMARRLVLPAALVLLCGCGLGRAKVLGHFASGPLVSVARLKPSPRAVIVRGAMIEKCPIAGCWFVLRDATGTVKVDTKAAGFTVTDVPLNTVVTVSGKVSGSQPPVLAASGVRY